jgi:hypothetical protein
MAQDGSFRCKVIARWGFDWKAGVHTLLLAAVKFITFNMKFKKRKLGMAPASIINFLSNEDTSRLAARFFIWKWRQNYNKPASTRENCRNI